MAVGPHRFEAPFERKIERSGKINERFVFGQVRVESPEYREDVQALVEKHRRSGTKVTFEEAVEVIKRYQPFEPDRRIPQDPTRPFKQFPRDLRNAIAGELGLKDKKQERLLFWTAVSSIVDIDFHADAVMELGGCIR